MTKAMSNIRFFYHKKIKELKEKAEMDERGMIKAGMITQSYGDYYKGIVSDLNAVLASAKNGLHAFEAELQYDADSAKALQDSINNIQEYKDKLISQYTK
jgi:hypothetical protein